MNRPTVSICVINLNGFEHLKKCLPSLICQNYPKELLEIIVVDNGSNDHSVHYIETNFPEIIIIKNKKNEGFARANNQAAAIAKGDLLAFINNDMIAAEDWTEQLVATMNRTGAECIASTILSWDGKRIDFVKGGMDPFGYGFQIDFGKTIENLQDYEKENEILFACGGAMLVNKQIYLSVGGLDEDFFAYFEDVDLGWRLWLLGYKVVSSPKAVTFHRHHGTASKFSRYKRVFHSELNALFMIYKNYSEENYLKFLVGALMLRLTRIAEGVRVNPNMFRFDYTMKKNLNSKLKNFIRKVRYLGKMKRILVQLAVICSFILQLPNTKEKRSIIQKNRKRSDQEIFKIIDNSNKIQHFKTDEFQYYFNDVFKQWDL